MIISSINIKVSRKEVGKIEVLVPNQHGENKKYAAFGVEYASRYFRDYLITVIIR